MIVKQGNNWVLYSADGTKRLGTFKTKQEAEKREAQIRKFK